MSRWKTQGDVPDNPANQSYRPLLASLLHQDFVAAKRFYQSFGSMVVESKLSVMRVAARQTFPTDRGRVPATDT